MIEKVLDENNKGV